MSQDDDGRGELVHVGDIPIDVPGVGRTLTAKRQARHLRGESSYEQRRIVGADFL